MPRHFASAVYNTFMRRPLEGSKRVDYSGSSGGSGDPRQVWLKQRRLDAALFDKLAKIEPGGADSADKAKAADGHPVTVKKVISPANSGDKGGVKLPATQKEVKAPEKTAVKTVARIISASSASELKKAIRYDKQVQKKATSDQSRQSMTQEQRDASRHLRHQKAASHQRRLEEWKDRKQSQSRANYIAAGGMSSGKKSQGSDLLQLLKSEAGRIVSGALSASGADDPDLKSLIRSSQVRFGPGSKTRLGLFNSFFR